MGRIFWNKVMKKNCSIKVIARDVWLSTPDDLDQATQLLLRPARNMDTQYTEPFECGH